MANVSRYILVDRSGVTTGDYFDDPREAKERAAIEDCAVVEHIYGYEDEDLVWTPDGSTVWPAPSAERAERDNAFRVEVLRQQVARLERVSDAALKEAEDCRERVEHAEATLATARNFAEIAEGRAHEVARELDKALDALNAADHP